jgi:hypothetical protein
MAQTSAHFLSSCLGVGQAFYSELLATRPYNLINPVVCFDESNKQLVEETIEPLPMEPGQPQRYTTPLRSVVPRCTPNAISDGRKPGTNNGRTRNRSHRRYLRWWLRQAFQ